MYKKVSNAMTNYIIKKGVGKQEYTEIYAYGFESLVSVVVNTIFLLILADIVGFEKEIIVYMIFFSCLRNCAGGMHKDTHLSCIMTYTIVAFIHIGIMKFLYVWDSRLTLISLCMYLVISLYLIFRYAPMDSKNKRLSEDEKEIQKDKSRKTIIMEIVGIFLLIVLKFEWLAVVGAVAIVTQSISLLPVLND